MTRQPTARQRAGARAEELALQYLRAAGLQLLARNVRYKGGELDLVMRDGAALVFVEVRWRTSAAYGGALASITAAKRQRLLHAAQCYLQSRYATRIPPCRFDVVAIEGGPPETGTAAEGSAGTADTGNLIWLRDAFGL